MSDFIQIYRDAETGSFVLRHVDETGAVISAVPQIRMLGRGIRCWLIPLRVPV